MDIKTFFHTSGHIHFLAIVICFLVLKVDLKAQVIDLNIQEDAACFSEGGDSILTYQIAEKSNDGNHRRSNYIHPLHALDGQVLTEDFPADHPHHRGIFWAWHQIYVGDGRLGDAWELKDFQWDIRTIESLPIKGSARALQAEVFWKSPLWLDAEGNKKPIVKETTTIKVFPSTTHYRKIDITISLLALEPNMLLGGSEDQKGYGGFSTRIKLADTMYFTGAAGRVVPDNLPVKSNGWIDISGPVGHEGAMAGLGILAHPDNPGFPNPWILRGKDSMQNAVYPFPGAMAVSLSQMMPTVLRYRLLVHRGDHSALDIGRLFDDFSEE